MIDLSQVTFVDSGGLGVLTDVLRWTRDGGGVVAVACPRPTLTRLLHTLEFHKLIPVAETLEEAVAALDPPA